MGPIFQHDNYSAFGVHALACPPEPEKLYDCSAEASRSNLGIKTCGKILYAAGHSNALRLVLGAHSRAPAESPFNLPSTRFLVNWRHVPAPYPSQNDQGQRSRRRARLLAISCLR